MLFLQQCSICHSPAAHATPGVGPSLFGVVGRKPGTRARYSYSAARKSAGISWTPDRLNIYIESPSRTIPGIKMPYGGLKDPVRRDDLVAYLETLK